MTHQIALASDPCTYVSRMYPGQRAYISFFPFIFFIASFFFSIRMFLKLGMCDALCVNQTNCRAKIFYQTYTGELMTTNYIKFEYLIITQPRLWRQDHRFVSEEKLVEEVNLIAECAKTVRTKYCEQIKLVSVYCRE